MLNFTCQESQNLYLASTKNAKFVVKEKAHKTWKTQEAAQKAIERLGDKLNGYNIKVVKITRAALEAPRGTFQIRNSE